MGVSYGIFFLIIFSSVLMWLETIPAFRYPNAGLAHPDASTPAFVILNDFTMILFTFEFFIRAISVTGALWKDIDRAFLLDDGLDDVDHCLGHFQQAFSKFFYWVRMPLTMIDFLAILPFLVEIFY